MSNPPDETETDMLMAFDPDDTFDFEDGEDFDWESEPIPAAPNAPPPAPVKPFDMAKLPQISQADLADLKTVEAWHPDAVATLAHDFLRDVKEDYEKEGIGYRHYVVRFRNPEGVSRFQSFRRNFTVRISHIRKQAAKSGVSVPKFWIAFVRVIPIEPNEDNRTADWLCTIARMDNKQYRAYAAERTRAAREQETGARMMTDSIGYL